MGDNIITDLKHETLANFNNGKENLSETETSNNNNNNDSSDDTCLTSSQPTKAEKRTLNPCRKSSRPRKIPVHLSETSSDASVNISSTLVQKRVLKTPTMRTQQKNNAPKFINKPKSIPALNPYPDFQCDHCGSRYVINPMRRGNKICSAPYKAAPRHKIDPETQKILSLCNACGLKFGRKKKERTNNKEVFSAEDKKKFEEDGERFAKELATKLEDENANRLFCSHMKRVPCGCIQKFICGPETAVVEEILSRGRELTDIVLKALELKKLKCYDHTSSDKKGSKIGLGNGHRKSKEFEEFVLEERSYLRDRLKFCEKATQKILSYSNNFLHKRLKTDPEKGVRIERQKGKAALGMLMPIQDLALENCCVDNCARMALTHGKLLETWRERATSSQLEARRVLAEMLTPSGGNRANCYRFVSWVTGCSNTTIGKVNEQMKSTGGDREPPEHGLKKYWKDNPKKKVVIPTTTAATGFVPSYQILQTAANSAGLSSMIENNTIEPLTKKSKHQSKNKGKIKDIIHSYDPTARISQTISLTDPVPENTTNLQNVSLLALNGNFPSSGFISIPTGLATNAITLQNAISLQQATQHHLQQQQQLQLQIQFLQQQLQNSQAVTALAQQHANDPSEYIVNVSDALEQQENTQQVAAGTPVVVQTQVSTPVVVQTVATQPHTGCVATQPVGGCVVSQSLLTNTANVESVLPTNVCHSTGGSINFLSPHANVSVLQQSAGNDTSTERQHNISLLTTPITNTTGEISILTSPVANNNLNVLTQQNNVGTKHSTTDNVVRPVHLITSQSPTMAHLSSQPISLHNPTTISLATLPTMLLSQTTSPQQSHTVVTQPQQQQQQQLVLHTHQSTNEQAVMIQNKPTLSTTSDQHLVLHSSSSVDQQPIADEIILQRSLATAHQANPVVNTQQRRYNVVSTSNDVEMTLKGRHVLTTGNDRVIIQTSLPTTQHQQQQVIFQKPSHSTRDQIIIHPALQTVAQSRGENPSLSEQLIIRSRPQVHSSSEQQVVIHPDLASSQSSMSQSQSEQIIIQRQSDSRSASSDHVVLQPTLQTVQSSPIVLQSSLQTVQSSQTTAEKVVTLSNSELPSMASFSSDPFFSSGAATTYAVINNGTLSHIQPRQIIDEQSSQSATVSVPFLQS